jgi:hypothetical protein
MSDQNSIVTRLARVEKEMRLWRIAAMLFGGCLLVTVSLGAGTNPEVARVIQAKEFQLVDDSGVIRATLKTLGNGTQLRMSDGTKKSEIAVVANDTNAIVHLTNDNRINSASIEAYASGGSMGLSRETGDGKALTHVVGGTEGAYVKVQPLKGEELRIPSK